MILSKRDALVQIGAYRKTRTSGQIKSAYFSAEDLKTLQAGNPSAGVRVFLGRDVHGKLTLIGSSDVSDKHVQSELDEAGTTKAMVPEIFIHAPQCPPDCG